MPRLCPQFNLRTVQSCLLMSFQTHSWVFPHTSLLHHSHSKPSNSCTGPSQQLLLQEPAPLPSGLQLATSLCLPTSNPQQSASFPVLSTLQPSVSLATWGSAHAGLPTSSTIQALPTSPFPSMVTLTASSKFTSPFPQKLPLQAQLGSSTLNSQSSAPPPPLPSASSFSNAQLVSLIQQFLEQVNSSSQPAPPSSPQPPSQVLQANTIADLCKHPSLQHQADAIMAALPLLSSSSALKGKSPGDLIYSAPIKFQQLLPHQFVTCLDSSNIKYTELDLPQFVVGFLDCIRHSPAHQQPYMSTHLSHLMDLASCFQWSAVRAYHGQILKALEQRTTTWSADFTRFQTGLLFPSQELPHGPPFNPKPRRAVRHGQKELVCKDWNFLACSFPCLNDHPHHCLVCKSPDHKAPACPKHNCSPSCTWRHTRS